MLLLEAGPDLRGGTPDAFREGWDIAPRELNWGYESLPNPRGKTQNVWRTKALGGTSWLTRFAVRGAPGDFEAWGPEWGWNEVLPWFKRIESDRDFGDQEWHGGQGPMPVDRYRSRDYQPATTALIEAAVAAGFPEADDHNRPGAVGIGRMPMSLDDGRRVTTVDAYLSRPAEKLSVRADVQVARILFDGERACGIETVDGETVAAAHVVLCAGVYGNPPLLMRSGVGPAEELRRHGLPVLVDLPGVGANLADHPAVTLELSPIAGEPGVLHAIATFHSSGTPTTEPPDLMLWLGDPDADGWFGVDVVLMRPRSRGSVRLRSADAREAPEIELPALDDETDRERLIEGWNKAKNLFAAPSADGDILEDAYSLPHVVGTCAIGPVVGQFGAVHGVENLTIADASIIPEAPSGFTHFPTIMLAERVAHDLKGSDPFG